MALEQQREYSVGESSFNEIEKTYPEYAKKQIIELNKNPEARMAREKMWQNVERVEQILDAAVLSGVEQGDAVSTISNAVMEVWERSVIEAHPDDDPNEAIAKAREGIRGLGDHLVEVMDTTQMLVDAADENFLEPEDRDILVNVVAPTHDMYKLLGAYNAQIMPDHEQIGARLLKKYLPLMGYRQDAADYAAAVQGDHENINKETDNGRHNYMRSPRPEERAKALFFLADTLTGVIEIDGGKLEMDSVQLEKRFGDLYFRHMDPETGKIFRPEWGLKAIEDYAEFLRIFSDRAELTGYEKVIGEIVESAQRALTKAVIHDEWRKSQGGEEFDHEQNERLRMVGAGLKALSEQYPTEEKKDKLPVTREVAKDADVSEVIDVVNHEAEKIKYGAWIFGGAKGITFTEKFRLAPVLAEGLAQWAKGEPMGLISGGTESGVMGLVGDVSKEIENTGGNLVLNMGFAPKDSVRYQGWSGGEGKELGAVYDISPKLTHFFAVIPGESKFGDEAELMQKSFDGITIGDKKSVGILANGGRFSANELRLNLASGRNVIVLAGTGRLADAVAAYLGEYEGRVEPEMVQMVQDIVDIHPEWRSKIKVVDLSKETKIEVAKKKFVEALTEVTK